MRRRRSGAGLCCAAAVALLLVLAPAASAGGDWGSKADFSHLNVRWSDDGGNPAFFTVFTLPVPVQSARTSDGRDCTVGQPDNNPNQVECPVNRVSSGSVTVATQQAMPCAASIQHKVSENGSSYVAQQAIVSRNNCGGGGGAANPCDCSKVTAFLNKFGVFGAGTTRIQFVVHAKLTCTPGTGTGCQGRLSVLAPKGANFVKPANGKTLKLRCAGACNKTTSFHKTLQYVALVKKGKRTVPNPGFTAEGRAGKTFKIKMSLSCVSPTGVIRPGKIVTMAVHFDKRGHVDYKKSDLNADGKPDGHQLK
jgi:hypothetical protein